MPLEYTEFVNKRIKRGTPKAQMIRIGYACINTALPGASKTFRLSGYTDERMIEVTRSNLLALKEILRWNLDHSVYLFRITSGLVPFGSHPVNRGLWKKALRKEFKDVGRFALAHSMRLSMHPGQYTVLNTPKEPVFERSIADIRYHNDVLSLMGLDNSHIIIIHGGGAYNNHDISLKNLGKRAGHLPVNLRGRVALENDERVFNAGEILRVCKTTGIPGIIDIFHHRILSSMPELAIRDLIVLFGFTWGGRRQKIHYSDQAPGKNKGAHSESVDIKAFGKFYGQIRDLDIDVMIEAKDKQESVLRLREAFPELE